MRFLLTSHFPDLLFRMCLNSLLTSLSMWMYSTCKGEKWEDQFKSVQSPHTNRKHPCPVFQGSMFSWKKRWRTVLRTAMFRLWWAAGDTYPGSQTAIHTSKHTYAHVAHRSLTDFIYKWCIYTIHVIFHPFRNVLFVVVSCPGRASGSEHNCTRLSGRHR